MMHVVYEGRTVFLFYTIALQPPSAYPLSNAILQSM